jgi:hypothetical protein
MITFNSHTPTKNFCIISMTCNFSPSLLLSFQMSSLLFSVEKWRRLIWFGLHACRNREQRVLLLPHLNNKQKYISWQQNSFADLYIVLCYIVFNYLGGFSYLLCWRIFKFVLLADFHICYVGEFSYLLCYGFSFFYVGGFSYLWCCRIFIFVMLLYFHICYVCGFLQCVVLHYVGGFSYLLCCGFSYLLCWRIFIFLCWRICIYFTCWRSFLIVKLADFHICYVGGFLYLLCCRIFMLVRWRIFIFVMLPDFHNCYVADFHICYVAGFS